MTILNVYNDYKSLNEEIIEFINRVLSEDSILEDTLYIKESINILIEKLDNIKVAGDLIDVDSENKQNLNDLKYLIHSTLFLLSDLEHFYNINELTRFKMRAVNYINHARRK